MRSKRFLSAEIEADFTSHFPLVSCVGFAPSSAGIRYRWEYPDRSDRNQALCPSGSQPAHPRELHVGQGPPIHASSWSWVRRESFPVAPSTAYRYSSL